VHLCCEDHGHNSCLIWHTGHQPDFGGDPISGFIHWTVERKCVHTSSVATMPTWDARCRYLLDSIAIETHVNWRPRNRVRSTANHRYKKGYNQLALAEIIHLEVLFKQSWFVDRRFLMKFTLACYFLKPTVHDNASMKLVTNFPETASVTCGYFPSAAGWVDLRGRFCSKPVLQKILEDY